MTPDEIREIWEEIVDELHLVGVAIYENRKSSQLPDYCISLGGSFACSDEELPASTASHDCLLLSISA